MKKDQGIIDNVEDRLWENDYYQSLRDDAEYDYHHRVLVRYTRWLQIAEDWKAELARSMEYFKEDK